MAMKTTENRFIVIIKGKACLQLCNVLIRSPGSIAMIRLQIRLNVPETLIITKEK